MDRPGGFCESVHVGDGIILAKIEFDPSSSYFCCYRPGLEGFSSRTGLTVYNYCTVPSVCLGGIGKL